MRPPSRTPPELEPHMPKHTVSLDDKYALDESRQLLTGTQAIVRLMLTQRARDVKAGLNTAGYVTGYRGSPIASLEAAMLRAKGILEPNHIKFMAGLNEDLAATALWGSQQAELRGEGKYDGVFGMWYGKGPGLDRTGDVFRHANHAGTSKNGGVLALMGDDHTCESSTSAHQSEFAFVDYMIPVLNPAGVQEILDYGILGWALSRYAGVWVGIKCVKDNIEATATVDGRIDRVADQDPRRFRHAARRAQHPPRRPGARQGSAPARLQARRHPGLRPRQQARPYRHQRRARTPKIGIITCGKSYLDVRAAFDELGIDEVKANQLGMRLYKVAMTWPLEPQGVLKFAEGLDLVLVIEEKRALIETQVKEQLYDLPNRPRVLGKKDENEQWLFPAKYALDPSDIAIKIGERLIRTGAGDDIKARVTELKRLKGNQPADRRGRHPHPLLLPRLPAQLVDRRAAGLARLRRHRLPLHGALDGPLHRRVHPDGRGGHQLDRRGAVLQDPARVPEPGRRHLHPLRQPGDPRRASSRRQHDVQDPLQRCRGHDRRAVAGRRHDRADDRRTRCWPKASRRSSSSPTSRTSIPPVPFPQGVPVHHRRELQSLQKELREVPGVSVLVYDQTCAAEKRRRRKRGLFPDPDKRVFINPGRVRGLRRLRRQVELRRGGRRSRPSSAPSAPSTSRPATRTSPASTASARASSRCTAPR